MKRLIIALFFCGSAMTAPGLTSAQADRSPTPLSLLDHLTGHWVMTGRLGAHTVRHDLAVQWVLNHEYIQFHEISRPQSPHYEAIVYITWNAKVNQYTCLWLDSTAAAPEFAPIGRAPQAGNSIPFVIPISPTDAIHTTFVYDAARDRWRLTIDDINQGKTSRFGDVELYKSAATM